MGSVATLNGLDRALADARAEAPGTATELAAILAYATRLVSDPMRRGELARAGRTLAERLGDEVAAVRCRAMVAEAVCRHEHPADALPDALAALADAIRLGDPQARAQAHHSVGHCFHSLDCTAEALEHVQQAHVAYCEAGDRFGEGRILSFMATQLCELGEDKRARELYERAFDIFVDCDDPSGAGVMLSCVAMVIRQHDPVEAAASCERALEWFERAGMPVDAMMAMTEYAEALAAQGRHDEAGYWADRAGDQNRLPDGTIANPGYELEVLMTRAGTALIPRGELAEALTVLREAVALADSLGAVRHTSSAESLLAETLHASGDIAAAYEHLRRSRLLTEEIAHAAHDRRVRALRVRFEVEQVQREALRYREQARAQADVIAELERTRAELAVRMADLERLHVEVTQLSRTDPLTGIANRRYMNEQLDELMRSGRRRRPPLAIAVFDVDRFKGINDGYGHETGDAVLVALTGLLRANVRTSDLPARLGGDEFALIMPHTTAAEAVQVCERLQAAVRAHPWHEIAPELSVSITIGVADGGGPADPDELLRLADAALYRGKRAGRDTVTS